MCCFIELCRIIKHVHVYFWLILRGIVPYDRAYDVYIERIEYGENNVLRVNSDTYKSQNYYDDYYDYYDYDYREDDG